MFLFLLLVIPCLIVLYNNTAATYSTKELAPVYTFGILSGVVYCGFKLFFVFNSHIWTTSLFGNLFSLYAHDVLIPCVIVYGLFYLISSKTDDINYRIKAFTPLILCFMAIFIPYGIISSKQQNVFFMIFIKPVLYASMTYLLGNLIQAAYKNFSEKSYKTGISISIAAVIISMLPALAEVFWYHKINCFIIIFAVLVQIALPVLYKLSAPEALNTDTNQ